MYLEQLKDFYTFVETVNLEFYFDEPSSVLRNVTFISVESVTKDDLGNTIRQILLDEEVVDTVAAFRNHSKSFCMISLKLIQSPDMDFMSFKQLLEGNAEGL